MQLTMQTYSSNVQRAIVQAAEEFDVEAHDDYEAAADAAVQAVLAAHNLQFDVHSSIYADVRSDFDSVA